MLLLFALLLQVAAQSFPGQQFRVTSLPGFKGALPSFGLYSGYITVDPNAGRALFFMFTEASEVNPATAPLIVWFTGGPGCSSLLAQFNENGPFAVDHVGSVSINPWAWNRRANMVWIESPAGVGFSYSNDTSDYNVGDARTTADAIEFVQRFVYEYFPQYQNSHIWMTGESYGGHYVPLATLAAYDTKTSARPLNVQGMMVGNAWTDASFDNAGALDTWWTHALIDKESVDVVKQACNLASIGPLAITQKELAAGRWFNDSGPVRGATCDAAVNYVQGIAFDDVNIYDIYADECNVNLPMTARHKLTKRSDPNPCIQNFLAPYLNDAKVQKALHALPTQWEMCSNIVSYDYQSVLTSMLPIYKKLFQTLLRSKILVYSGDVDAIVPFLGTRSWIASLGLPIKKRWRSWFVNDTFGEQVGGFVEQFSSMTFATVRNAGHEVPFYQPRRAFYMFANFLANQTLPTH